jgi:hypothetical protein
MKNSLAMMALALFSLAGTCNAQLAGVTAS